MIHNVRDDLVLQVPCQEPSMSSKYGHQGQVVLGTLPIILESWNLAHKSRIPYQVGPCQGWPYPLSTWSGTTHVLKVWTLWMGGSWHTSNPVRELKSGTQVKNPISGWSMVSWMTLSSKYLVRNHQHIPVWTSRTGDSLNTSNPDRELKFGTHVKNHIMMT